MSCHKGSFRKQAKLNFKFIKIQSFMRLYNKVLIIVKLNVLVNMINIPFKSVFNNNKKVIANYYLFKNLKINTKSRKHSVYSG